MVRRAGPPTNSLISLPSGDAGRFGQAPVDRLFQDVAVEEHREGSPAGVGLGPQPKTTIRNGWRSSQFRVSMRGCPVPVRCR